MSEDLSHVEEHYGFVFGDPNGETKKARSGKDAPRQMGTAVCQNPTCPERAHVAYYEDQDLPLHCGQCFTVLVANPDPDHVDASLHVSGLDLANVEQVLDAVAERVAAKILAAKKSKG